MSTTATAIASVALIQSANSSQQAREAKVMACKAMMPTFTDEASNTSQKIQYASCVNMIHSEPLTGDALILAKVAIVVCFVGFFIGFWYGWKERDGFIYAVLSAIMGLLGAIAAMILLGLAAYGIHMLFS